LINLRKKEKTIVFLMMVRKIVRRRRMMLMMLKIEIENHKHNLKILKKGKVVVVEIKVYLYKLKEKDRGRKEKKGRQEEKREKERGLGDIVFGGINLSAEGGREALRRGAFPATDSTYPLRLPLVERTRSRI